MYNRPEILAPAGSMEALRAAVECGADAVYLGAGHFNARRNAKNFTADELRDAIEYCHVRGVKVHLTLNTLVSDGELPEAIDLIEEACALGVDALIVQDPGIAALVRASAPDMELHASTQMAVMTPEGFRELAALGFDRAVLPRELSLDEIRAIRKATEDTGLELEMFIHGALCMCVSGQCYLSAMMGGRSGNRGLCAQPCRLDFSAGETPFALSLRDLSAISEIPSLFDSGVVSFKIEGRMKRPEYVAAAVTACRNAVDGIVDERLESELDAVFSRSGHTDAYLRGTRGPDLFGTRQKEDVVAAAPILKDLEALYRKETRTTPVSLDFTAHPGKPLRLRATQGNCTVSVDSGDIRPEPAQNAPATKETVLRQLVKSGGTGFSIREDDVNVDLSDGLFLPASVLNELRREALEALKKAVLAASVRPFDRSAAEALLHPTAPVPRSPFLPDGTTVIRLRTPEQFPEHIPISGPVAWLLPVGTPAAVLEDLSQKKSLFGIEVPRGLYENTARVRGFLKEACSHGAAFAYAGTLDGVALAKEAGLPVLGGFTLNGFNSLALRELAALGLSALTVSQELKLAQIAALDPPGIPLGVLVYGRQPLMLTRPAPNGLSDRDFSDAALPMLLDRKGILFPVARNGDAYELLNSRPLDVSDKQDDLPEHGFRLFYMTTESSEDVTAVLERYERRSPPEGEFTRGLYYKGVQ